MKFIFIVQVTHRIEKKGWASFWIVSLQSAMAGSNRTWYHKQLGRMETEKLLMESREDGSFLIRASDTVKGAYVLSTM